MDDQNPNTSTLESKLQGNEGIKKSEFPRLYNPQEENNLQKAGEAIKKGGQTTESAGKGLNYAGKGMSAGGKGLMRAGEALSGTGAGAAIGAPLVAAGAVLRGAGVAARLGGRELKKSGSSLKQAGQNIEQKGKKLNSGENSNDEKELSSATTYLMVSVALIIDGLQFLINLIPLVGQVISFFITIFAYMLFWLWFRINGINLFETKRAMKSIVTFLAEMIPFIDMLPAWTYLVVTTANSTKIKKVMGEIPGGKELSKAA